MSSSPESKQRPGRSEGAQEEENSSASQATDGSIREMQYVYSFLLSPLSIGCFRELELDGEDGRAFLESLIGKASLEKRIIEKYSSQGIDDVSGPVIHMGEELVHVPARLPLYHRFPHISVSYSLGEWKVLPYVEEAEADETHESISVIGTVQVEINIFVFESGAGLLIVTLRGGTEETIFSLEDGESLPKRLEKAFRMADFPRTGTSVGYNDSEQPYLLVTGSSEGNESGRCQTLQGLYFEELDRFVDVLNNLPDGGSSVPQAKGELQSRAIVGVNRLEKLHPIDREMLSELYLREGGERRYRQRPFIISTIESNNLSGPELERYNTAGEENGVDSGIDKFRQWIGSVLREELASDSKPKPLNLRDLGVEENAICFHGRSGVVTLIESDADARCRKEAAALVLRSYGSVRLLWHAMTVMNTYMGKKLAEISDQIKQIRTSDSTDSDSDTLQKQLGELENWRSSFYAFLMADDPIINAVHFSSYSQMFREASDGYNFFAVKNELWQKLKALDTLRGSLRRSIDYASGHTLRRYGRYMLYLILFLISAISVFYLAEASLVNGLGLRFSAEGQVAAVVGLATGITGAVMLLLWPKADS